MDTTTELFIEPSAIVVDLADELVTLCHEFLPPGGLTVYRVAHAHAACERIAVLLPRLVVVPAAMRSEDLDMIEDRAAAVGAMVLHLDADHGYEVLGAQLDLTVRDLRMKYGAGGPRS
jgi:CheY-like chemotaxis protein